MSRERMVNEPLTNPSAKHLKEYHMYPSPLMNEGLKTRVERGEATKSILTDGTEFHLFDHGTEHGPVYPHEHTS